MVVTGISAPALESCAENSAGVAAGFTGCLRRWNEGEVKVQVRLNEMAFFYGQSSCVGALGYSWMNWKAHCSMLTCAIWAQPKRNRTVSASRGSGILIP
jgi:hypothetical protein